MLNCLLVGLHLGREVPPQHPSAVAQFLFEDALASNWEDSQATGSTMTVTLDGYFPRGPFFSHPPNNSAGTTTVNLPVLRECLLALSAARQFVTWRRTNSRGAVVLCFHYLPVSAALVLLSFLTRTPTVVIFTDLPLFSYSTDRVAAMPWWKRPFMKSYRKMSEWLCARYDGFVLFTQAMGPLVNPNGKPSIVVEGIFNDEGIPFPRLDKIPGVIAHAGTLDRAYGIGQILDAFDTIAKPDAQLWLFGSGDMDDAIAERATADPRITHFGFLQRKDLFAQLSQASVLAVLRDPSAEFTRYSFPSKLFEYLATGSVVATTALPGIPEPYFDHLVRIVLDSPESVGRQLLEVLEAGSEDLRRRGEGGRNFVLNQKTPRAQADRIKEFVLKVANPGAFE